MVRTRRLPEEEPGTDDLLAADLQRLARPLRSEDDLEGLCDRIGGARYVLLDQTSALHPLHFPAEVGREVPETFPTGV